MIIPVDALDPETLTAIIEEHVLGEGTDYGPVEYTKDQKVAHVRAQLESGQAVIVYSELHNNVNIVLRTALENQ